MTEGGVRCVAPVGDLCGEGAVWSAAERCLYWVDINRFLTRRVDAAGRVASWYFDEPATALALTDRPGTLLVALASRLILWRPEDDNRAAFGPPLAEWPRVRFNDGRPDPQGRLMIGTMGNNVGPDGEDLPVAPGLGTLYRVGADGGFVVEEDGIGISNTICWSPDGGTFYFADTLANEIQAYPVDADGALGTPRRFFAGYDRGAPDGSAVDTDGFIWNCRHGGGCVVRLTPEGAVDRVVEVPCDNPTTCTFGGEDLRTLYITSARGGSEKSQRLAGSLFALDVSVPGLPERVFRLG
jgi:sugar lactone lactonase YvrE